MTLRVPYSDFAPAATRFEVREAYLIAKNGHTEISSVMKTTGRILFSRTETPLEEVREDLTKKGLHVFDGAWSIEPPEDELRAGSERFVAAVSYVSGESTPGVWVDAYPWQPTQVQVLRALYDEFRDTGEVGEVPFEEFIRLASPNVVIVSPSELEGYLESKNEPCA
ncbi:MAG TPA: hypothetical protein VKT78_02880 [Fimbriimonadaceae bacterium]|nr:hypothetical protein [Fimbriimonadaceae bacterium]